jgi:hypothetical protein
MLQQGQVAAISTTDTVLAGLMTQDPQTKVVGPRFTFEPQGLGMAKNAKDLVRFVNAVLEEDENGWQMEAAVRALHRHPDPAANPRPACTSLLRCVVQELSLAGVREALKPTPARLLAGMLVTIAASLLWGVAAAYTAVDRTSAANDMVATSGPLSFYAQQIYQSLSDADALEAAAFLAVSEPAATRAEFLADIERAGTYLRAVTAADPTSAAMSGLSTLGTEIPEYTMLIGKAEADSRDGLPVGASYLQEASYLMRGALIPAADGLYRQENARLASSYAKASGFPVIAVIVAVLIAIALFRVQFWLTSRTHRVLNRGLLAASVAGVLSLAWLLGSFLVARTSLISAHDDAAAAQSLVQAQIAVLRAHADESLTLINRSGDDASEADFKQAEKQLGPGAGTLLSRARAVGGGSPGYRWARAAASAATAWYTMHLAVRDLDNGGDYPDAVYLAIGSGPAASPAEIQRQEAALAGTGRPGPARHFGGRISQRGSGSERGINADHASFTASASRGDRALGGLAAGMVIASLLMTAGCAVGLTRRIAEYR